MSRLERLRTFAEKNRILVVTLSIIMLSLLIIFSTQAYLFVNFLLGNDIVVQLGTDKHYFSLANQENATVQFVASSITNPFCKAHCTSALRSVTTGKVVDSESFVLRTTDPYEKSYVLQAPPTGHGQQLYQYMLECRSEETSFCHTDEEPTSRTILLAMDYHLSEEQIALKQDIKQILEAAMQARMEIERDREFIANLTRENLALNMSIPNRTYNMDEWTDLWNREKYAALEEEMRGTRIFSDALQSATSREQAVDLAMAYNDLLTQLENIREILDATVINASTAVHVQEETQSYNAILDLMRQRSSIQRKQQLADGIANDVETIRLQQIEDSLRLALHADISAQALCIITGSCIPHPDVKERAELPPSPDEACTYANQVRETLIAAGNTSGNATIAAQLVKNISVNMHDALQNETYSNITRSILENLGGPINGSINASLINDSLIGFLPRPACIVYSVPEPDEMNLSPITIPDMEPIQPSILGEPSATCCRDGTCTACCQDCSDALYPVIFLHGHAFNRETLPDYSLDAFKQIQSEFQDDGILNAGAVSLYSEQEMPQGAWGRTPVRMSIKASYYFDLFKEPENYVVVPTKSENIDTYAVRLNDLIDTIQYRTGKEKVVIVAHSMGGLVARRYVQIFGSDNTHQLILIGTPNKGVRGNVAEFCPIIGENLECRDMRSDSLFINKLNRERQDVPILNIIGTGCDMDGGTGDGVVTAENAALEYAQNVYVNGTCRTLEPLHTKLLEIDEYPEVYTILKEAIS